MTDQALHELIFGDPTAKAHADAGRDEDAAIRARAIAPQEKRETRETFLGIAKSLGPELAGRLITSIRAAIAGGNVLLDEVQWSLRNGGVDLAHQATVATLDALAAAGIQGGLSAQDATAISALAEFAPIITADDVSRVWAIHRN